MEAAQEGHVDLVKFLLERGTLHFIKINSERNPSQCFATNNPKGDDINFVLHIFEQAEHCCITGNALLSKDCPLIFLHWLFQEQM